MTRDQIIEAMASIQAEADCDGILCTHRDCTCRIIAGRQLDAALPFFEQLADEDSCGACRAKGERRDAIRALGR